VQTPEHPDAAGQPANLSPHPSRSAPLCGNCLHRKVGASLGPSRCGHPGAPVDLVFGAPSLSCEDARSIQSPCDMYFCVNHCGPAGVLFAPAPLQCPTCSGVGQLRKPYARGLEACPDCSTKRGAP